MKRELARRLSVLEGFRDPTVELEQYATSPALAANLVHLADLHDDLDRWVIDLGTGTGMLALAAATRGPPGVVGLDVDRGALQIARENELRLLSNRRVSWVQGDATESPLCHDEATVLSNPPFGAQHGARGADRAFLEVARALGVVSYSIHNAESRSFIEAFARDNDGDVTHAFESVLPMDAQFEFHTADRRELPVEVYRIEWGT